MDGDGDEKSAMTDDCRLSAIVKLHEGTSVVRRDRESVRLRARESEK